MHAAFQPDSPPEIISHRICTTVQEAFGVLRQMTLDPSRKAAAVQAVKAIKEEPHPQMVRSVFAELGIRLATDITNEHIAAFLTRGQMAQVVRLPTPEIDLVSEPPHAVTTDTVTTRPPAADYSASQIPRPAAAASGHPTYSHNEEGNLANGYEIGYEPGYEKK